ncbi:unnamed protein product [Schistosoma turkestanicum]|nr:unnamed protein product [Schistosoma turkestanicum]
MGLLPLLDASDVLVLHCPLCSFHTHWLNYLEIHFNHEHANESVDFMLYQCSKCRKIASCKTFLIEHIDICHKNLDKSATIQLFRTQSPNDSLSDCKIVDLQQRNSPNIEHCDNNNSEMIDPNGIIQNISCIPTTTHSIDDKETQIVDNIDQNVNEDVSKSDVNDNTDNNNNNKTDTDESTDPKATTNTTTTVTTTSINDNNGNDINNTENNENEEPILNDAKNSQSPYIKILFIGQLCGNNSTLSPSSLSPPSSTSSSTLSMPSTTMTLSTNSQHTTLSTSLCEIPFSKHTKHSSSLYHLQKLHNHHYLNLMKHQCLFCDYISSDSMKLSEHYVQHGIRQLQLSSNNYNLQKLKKLHKLTDNNNNYHYLSTNSLPTMNELNKVSHLDI